MKLHLAEHTAPDCFWSHRHSCESRNPTHLPTRPAPEAHNSIPTAEATVAPKPNPTSSPKTVYADKVGTMYIPAGRRRGFRVCFFGVPAADWVLFCTTCPDLAGSKKEQYIIEIYSEVTAFEKVSPLFYNFTIPFLIAYITSPTLEVISSFLNSASR